MSVTVVVDERATGIPPRGLLNQPRLCRDLSESAVAIVVIQGVLAVVADEQVFVTVVVVVADAYALSPSRACQPSFHRNISESAVAIVLKQMAGRLFTFGKSLQPP